MQKPKLLAVFNGEYSKKQFMKDLTSGFMIGILAIPLSIALAIASGVSPERGLYTAMIAGFAASLLGSSRVQIDGPAAIFVIITYDIIQKNGYPALALTIVLAGIILILMGLMKLGNVIKYLPYPIITGFTSGIAVVIFVQQIKDFLGLKINKLPSGFFPMIGEYIKTIDTLSISSLMIGVVSLLIMIGWPYINKKVPGALVTIIISTGLVRLLGIRVETIGDRFSNIKFLPSFTVPQINPDMVAGLLPGALTIALLACIESLLSADVADGMTGDKHHPDTELIVQGTANIFSGFFGGIPAAGSITQTVANIRNGGRTPVAGIIHSLTILVTILLFVPYAEIIPMPTLAAILMVMAYKMSEWRVFINLFKAPKTDIAILLTTFVLTFLFNIRIAIEFGIILAAFLFMKRMADASKIEPIRDEIEANPDIAQINPEGIDPSIQIFQIYGPFFFGAVDKFLSTIQENIAPTHVLIIRMKHVPFMDATGYHALFKTYSYCRSHRILLLLTQVQEQPLDVMDKHRFIELAGKDNFCDDIEHALIRADAYVELQSKFPRKGH